MSTSAQLHHYRVNSPSDLREGMKLMKNGVNLVKRSPQAAQCNCPCENAGQPNNPGAPPPQFTGSPGQPSPNGPQPQPGGAPGVCNLVSDPNTNLPITDELQDHANSKNGRTLQRSELDSIQKAMGFPDYKYFLDTIEAKFPAAWCPGKSPEEKIHGAYIVMSTAMKLRMLPLEKWSTCDNSDDGKRDIKSPNSCEQTIGVILGKLKTAGRSDDGATVAKILTDNGGNTFGMCNDMLKVLWGGNEHQKLHYILCHPDEHNSQFPPLTDADMVFHAVHITSLSDGMSYWDPAFPKDIGGFNNEGSWPQRGWWTSASNYPRLFPEAFGQ